MPGAIANKNQHSDVIYRLTALWALSESGIGGIMFAFKIPLTGLLLGANAIILLTLIAFYSTHKFSQIVKATLLVIIVKILVSPHSSPAAYLAVAFQGGLAAVLFSNFPSLKFSALLLGIISMLESALQKLILLTIVFGTEFWEAINVFFLHISKELSLKLTVDYAFWLIFIYLFAFALWGLAVGNFAAKLPGLIVQQSDAVLKKYYLYIKNYSGPVAVAKQSDNSKRVLLFSILFIATVFIVFTFYFPNTSWLLLGRTLLILFVFYFLFLPFSKWITQRWLKKRSDNDISAAKVMIAFMPQIRQFANIAYGMAATEKSNLKRMKSFILYAIIITLNASQQDENKDS